LNRVGTEDNRDEFGGDLTLIFCLQTGAAKGGFDAVLRCMRWRLGTGWRPVEAVWVGTDTGAGGVLLGADGTANVSGEKAFGMEFRGR